jgi:hypothetical protein
LKPTFKARKNQPTSFSKPVPFFGFGKQPHAGFVPYFREIHAFNNKKKQQKPFKTSSLFN